MITKILKKGKNSTSSSLFAGIVVIMAMFMTVGCDKDESKSADLNSDDCFGRYTKELTVYDADRKNSAVILLGSNDKSILDLYDSQSFRLITISDEQKTEEVVSNYFASYASDSINDKSNVLDESNDIQTGISIKFLSRNFTGSVKGYFLVTESTNDEDLRADWIVETHYSDEYGHVGQNVNNRVWCTFYGQNFWHRGYYRLEYLANWGSFYYYITKPDFDWIEIKDNDDPQTYYRSPCYTMRAQRKYRGTPNSVVLVFAY